MNTYVFSDLHSQYNLWGQLKNYIKPEDKAYCLGDCIDRGPAAFEILTEIMDAPNIILLCGNHEDFINSIGSEIIPYIEEGFHWSHPKMSLWRANGAEKTIKAFCKMTPLKRLQLIDKIKSLPTHIEYTNTKGDIIYLCHAGRQPDTAEIPDMHMGSIPMNNYIWDRSHISDLLWRGKDNEYCIHGHTPVGYIYHFLNDLEKPPPSQFEIYKYCEGHKIDIDLGSFYTNRACLLNLDTFEPIYFKEK